MAAAHVSPMLFEGVVLAGGLSRRMGHNKALLTRGGVVLWRIQLGGLAMAGGGAMRVSVRRGADWLPHDVPRVEDDGSAGPLGGIAAALNTCHGTHLLVLAVDLPQIPSAWWTQLRDLCAPGVGAVGRHPEGHYEPLAAIYPCELARDARQVIEAQEFSLQQFIRHALAGGHLREIAIAPEQVDWFRNLNSPSDVGEK